MLSTPMTRRADPSRHRAGAERPGRVAEFIYNLVLGVLLGGAVLLFIAGGTRAELQVLWSYALSAVGVGAVLFFAHLHLARRR